MELNREQILEADDLKIEKVEVPEWGGDVFVRSLSADESFSYNKGNVDENGEVKKDENFIVLYCSFVMCDSQGKQIFSEEDVSKLGKKNSAALMRVYEAGKKLNGDDIEELEKNLETTQSEDSDSD